MVHDSGDALVGTEHLEDPEGLLGERLDRAEQRDLGVERFAGPGDEGGRNAEGDVVVAPHEKGRAGGVPGGVAAGLEGCPQASGWKARGIRLTLHQLGAGEVEDHTAGPVGSRQRIVLLRGESGQRLEPVGVVRRPILDRPILHGGRHHVGHRGIERLAPIDGAEQAAIDLLGKPLPHHGAGEDVAAEDAVDPLRRGLAAIEGTYCRGHGCRFLTAKSDEN